MSRSVSFLRPVLLDRSGPRPRRGRSFPSAALPLVWSLALAGCGEAGLSSEGGFVRSDSAGVWIAENTSSAWEEGEEWMVGPTPSLEIGVMDGDAGYQFSQVIGVMELPDGHLLVADLHAPDGMLRLFSPEGELLGSALPRGEGPREAQTPRWVGAFPEGGVAVWDQGLQRLSRLDGGSEGLVWMESRPFDLTHPSPPDPPEGAQLMLSTPPAPLGFLEDGSMVAIPSQIMGGGFGERLRLVRTVYRWDHEGDFLGEIGTFPMVETTLPDVSAGVTSLPPTPFPARFVMAVDGNRILHGADTEGYLIRVLSPEGEVEGLIRRPGVSLAVTPELRERWREAELEGIESEEERREMSRSLENVVFPASHAPFRQLRVDPTGHLWVQDEALPGQEVPDLWQIFDPEGRHLGAVVMPEGFTVHEVGVDHLVGVWTDDLEVPYIHRYPIRRSGS